MASAPQLELPEPVEPASGTAEMHALAHLDALPGSLGEAIGELEWDAVVQDALGAPVYGASCWRRNKSGRSTGARSAPGELTRYFEPA